MRFVEALKLSRGFCVIRTRGNQVQEGKKVCEKLLGSETNFGEYR